MTLISRLSSLVFVLSLIVLSGCNEQAEAPDPAKLTRDAIGHYCNMIVADHPGPKAQIYEQGRAIPLWFSSVRDGLAYLALPGEAQKVSVIYVHDMGQAESWMQPQSSGIWIDAVEAVYVIDSTKRGGMGAKESVPFKDKVKAVKFVEKFGGRIVAYADIPSDYILGDDNEHAPATAHNKGHDGHDE